MSRAFILGNVTVYDGDTGDRLYDGLDFTFDDGADRLTIKEQYDVNDIMFTNLETGAVTHEFPKRDFFYILLLRLAYAENPPRVCWFRATPARFGSFRIEFEPFFVVSLAHRMVSSTPLRMARTRGR